MHENRVNGKKYIGITSQRPERRWQNGFGYKGNSRFFRAIEKYGWDSFRHEILYTGLTQSEAEGLEIKLIEKYQTLDDKYGYNLALGGGTSSPTEETRAKMSASSRGEKNPMFGKHPSAETLAKRSAAMKGHGFSAESIEKLRAANLGKKMSDESRAKMSEAAKNRVVSDATRKKLGDLQRGALNMRAHAVCCVTTGEVFDTVGAAAKAAGVSTTVVSRCCSGRRKPACGLEWTYATKEGGVNGHP